MNRAFNILLAEDNPDDVFMLRVAFKKAGVTSRLVAVSDGMEAVAYLKGEDPYHDRAEHPYPDVLLLDLNMPRMSGFEVLEWVRHDAQSRQLVVHVLSASARDTDLARAYDLHANSFIVKPSRVDQLVAFVVTLHQWHQFAGILGQPKAVRVLDRAL